MSQIQAIFDEIKQDMLKKCKRNIDSIEKVRAISKNPNASQECYNASQEYLKTGHFSSCQEAGG